MSAPTPSPDRAVSALADAIGDSRPRRADDAGDDIPVAATVVILRDTADGPQVLLIERPDRGSFAGAWVFPGGKLDAADHRARDAEEDTARRAAVRETVEEVGLVVDAADLVTLSCWDPPPGLKVRIRTWFFVVAAPDGPLTLSPDEAVTAEWVAPAEVLARHGRGELTLYPPTWVTLHHLVGHPDAGSVLDSARLGGIRRFETVARRGAEGPLLLWHGDAEYEERTDAAASAARHRLEIGALPWRYTEAE
ncbi:NUDIX hydrolase [Microbacterium gallinarum]|jgi:8-oxo-dGTP pyrophosphatase MutT (NUDIX family)|uniref:NUDIX domain-containing protein n=1 Tax=Microbacterium gallinarum TaxID=2762209 RepID=A0ABR8WZ66_9MICO|nr:NUDIX domain-containing protein [Microbacterium gallinarum]MBD8022167.1 NUDIX domain-containing protein [Microbacterium gallinarum]